MSCNGVLKNNRVGIHLTLFICMSDFEYGVTTCLNIFMHSVKIREHSLIIF